MSAVATRYVDTKTAAKHVGLSVSWFNQKRVFGGGPPYIKVGGAVRYDIEALDDWMSGNQRDNTSQAA